MEGRRGRALGSAVAGVLVAALAGCDSGGRTGQVASQAESCMTCHNGSQKNDYTGPGLENPHPFGAVGSASSSLRCTSCHGGNPNGADKLASHVPPPPEIGDELNLTNNQQAYFNRLTLTGIDKFPDYTVGSQTYSAIDYLQFINPGDLRVVTQSRSCGQCHAGHGDLVANSLLATEAGILSGAMYAAGVENQLNQSQGLYQDTAADVGFRAATDPGFVAGATGVVDMLDEYPVYSVRNQPGSIHNNAAYDAAQVNDDFDPLTGRVITGSPLADLYHEQVAFTCGDCHLGSAGANNRYGDFRSSGCTACHMRYSLSGRSGSLDPNVNKLEPIDPDDIDPPEMSHVKSHRIASVYQTTPSGVQIEGIDDYACAGCHQGSNRTVMQYWGIRLDQNEDLRRGVQYPEQPASYVNTHGDPRLFDPVVNNNTFNGRRDRQYIRFEDYDGDLRDDTPEDVHYEAGMGCIDCHGSYDLHGGDPTSGNTPIRSRMEQAVGIACESCHGGIDAYAATVIGTAYDGSTAEIAVDSVGNPLPHVVKEADGYYLYSRLTGARHYVSQTRDTVVDSGVTNTISGLPVYSDLASYAMGKADGDPLTGLGPQQDFGVTPGFTHTTNMDCASCHASWTNTCMGCHLEGEYDGGQNFSNITGERIVFDEENADFVYQSPVFFQLGIDPSNKITQFSSNTKMFFQWEDRFNTESDTFAFSDRNAQGNDPGAPLPSLSHNAMMAHSIRGKVSLTKEGPRYCVACHLTTDSVDPVLWRPKYDAFRTALQTGDVNALDFTELTNEIGLNPGNQNNSPYFVHMVAGLGSGLFFFDEDGCPVNPIDTDNQRKGCDNGSPAANFATAVAAFNLDRVVDELGLSQGSNNHPMLESSPSPSLRDGAANPNLSGPLGWQLLQKLADPDNGIVLDSWIDANGDLDGNAGAHIP